MKAFGWTVLIIVYQGIVIVGSTRLFNNGLAFVASCGFFGVVLPLLVIAFVHWLQRRQTINDLKEMKKYLNDYENDDTELHT